MPSRFKVEESTPMIRPHIPMVFDTRHKTDRTWHHPCFWPIENALLLSVLPYTYV